MEIDTIETNYSIYYILMEHASIIFYAFHITFRYFLNPFRIKNRGMKLQKRARETENDIDIYMSFYDL
jgi:hypothetical protein